VREPARRDQHAPAGQDAHFLPVALHHHPCGLAVLNDDVPDGGVGPDRGFFVEGHIEHLPDERPARRKGCLAAGEGSLRACPRASRYGESLRASIEVDQLGGVPRIGRQARHFEEKALLQLLEPWPQAVAIEDHALDRPAACLSTLCIRVVIGVALAAAKRETQALEEGDHLRASIDVRLPALVGGGGADIADHVFEICHRIFVGVLDPFCDHEGVVRDPQHSPGHGCRSPDDVALFKDECLEALRVDGEGARETPSPAADGNEIGRKIPLCHLYPPDEPLVYLRCSLFLACIAISTQCRTPHVTGGARNRSTSDPVRWRGRPH
jgi:hypothetical protein